MSLRFVPPVHRATHRIGLYLANLGAFGLSQGEAHILAHLATCSPASISQLHRRLAHKRSTLTSILDRLVGRKLVTREVGATDRRTFIVTPTAKGRVVARRVHRHLAGLERAVARRVSAGDRAVFLKVLAVVEEEARCRTRT
ncbi:MAG: MarR family transcriptional regulator [Acidobacteria bacterium]|nr:MarR family transcriptional regulator [Acidobacteriota bacterium]